jgi:hypothetical protein
MTGEGEDVCGDANGVCKSKLVGEYGEYGVRPDDG